MRLSTLLGLKGWKSIKKLSAFPKFIISLEKKGQAPDTTGNKFHRQRQQPMWTVKRACIGIGMGLNGMEMI